MTLKGLNKGSFLYLGERVFLWRVNETWLAFVSSSHHLPHLPWFTRGLKKKSYKHWIYKFGNYPWLSLKFWYLGLKMWAGCNLSVSHIFSKVYFLILIQQRSWNEWCRGANHWKRKKQPLVAISGKNTMKVHWKAHATTPLHKRPPVLVL